MEGFSPFRVVGAVCGEVPVSSTVLYGAPVLMVATGRTFQLFRGKELSMLRGGPHFHSRVRAVAQTGKYRFVAEGPHVHGFTHHKPIWTCAHHDITQSKVNHLLAADDILFCIGQDKRVAVRAVKSGKLLGEFLIERSEEVRTAILPTGYTNKLLIATAEGSLHLYNFKTGVCLWYAQRESDAQILSLAAGRYKDIIAYGTSCGRVVVLNLLTNEEIMIFEHKYQGAVSALAFRVDKSILVSGTTAGEVVLWDLENRCLEGVLTRSKQVRSEVEVFETPHTDAIHSIVFLPTDGTTMVTAGADNALMQFRFDTVDGLGMLVRERRGHMGSCTNALFYNTDLLLTAGTDRALRVTHVFSDRASWELSQGKLGRRGREKQMGREALKATPVIAMASCTARNYQWSSVVSLHEASAKMCCWRMDTRSLECKLSGITTSMHTARTVALSDCGNFAVVGYSSGNVAIISIQNRSVKQLFDVALQPNDLAHTSSVECVEIACGNSVVVTAGLDSRIKLWDLLTGRLRCALQVDCPMSKSCLHQPSSLFIVAQHFKIRVYHCNPDVGFDEDFLATPVREFDGQNGPITALALAPDSYRYVVSASGDAVLLVWDLAAAACVGQYRLASPATSLSFHPDALFMVSTHAGERGAFLWSNNLRYGFVPEVVTDPKGRRIEQVPLLHFPTAHGGDELQEDEQEHHQDEEEEEVGGGMNFNGLQPPGKLTTTMSGRKEEEEEAELFDASKDSALIQRQRKQEQWAQLDGIVSGGLRLAGVPRSLWFNLTLLDQIKEKNMPLLPPKKRDVPFFLPTTQELRPTFLVVASSGKAGEAAASQTHFVGASLLERTPVQRMLMHGEHEKLMLHLLALKTPQAIDLEIKRAVEYTDGVSYSKEEIDCIKSCVCGLFSFLAVWLRRRENVDLVQGILADVIRSHGTLLTKCGEEMVTVLEEVAQLQNAVRHSMDHLVGYPSCLVGTFSGSLF
ncbi:U3 small nucleolar RNA-associated protein 21 [Trypanosoma cruzi]|nr:U3 small nucleolar RNA-associated protein 21 [Trypanosoma cruzi]